MAFDFTILPARRLGFFRMSGVLTVREGRARFLDYVQADQFDPRFTLFTDATAVESADVSFTELFMAVVGMQSALRKFDQPVDSVFLLGSETLFGTARMLQQVLASTTKINLRPTLSEMEALIWAGVEVSLAQLRAEAGFGERDALGSLRVG